MLRLLLFLLILSAYGCESKPPVDITDPGQLLFLGYAKKEINCARCHGPAGEGGQDAPDIRNAYEEYSETDILFFIENGKGDGKDAMPAMQGQITEQEIQHLLKFLRTLEPRPSQPAKLSPVPISPVV